MNEKQNSDGLEEETPGKNGDPEAENLTVDEHLQINVVNAGKSALTTFQNMPAIRFLPDGTIDENSPQMMRLTDGISVLWLIELKNRTGYEISDNDK